MNEFIVNTNQTFTAEQIGDLLCSALEGGSNDWYFIEDVVSPTTWEFTDGVPLNRGPYFFHLYPLNPDGALLICDRRDALYRTMRLDRARMQQGLLLLAKKYPQHLNAIIMEQADAETGDAFLQCCFFGEIIYG